MTFAVLEDLDTVVSIDDEIVDHDCPLHADLDFDTDRELDAHAERWLELACMDVTFHEEGARHWQLKLEREDLDYRDRAFAIGQMRSALNGARRIREVMRRTLAGEAEPEVPTVDLWARN